METGVKPASRLRDLFRGDSADILAIVIYAGSAGILSLAVPLGVQLVVNTVALGVLQQQLVVLTSITFFVVLLMGGMRVLQLQTAEHFQRRLAARIALKLSHSLPRALPSQLNETFGPDYINKFMELFSVQKSAAELLLETSKVIFQLAVGFILLSIYHPFFLIISLTLSIIVVLIIFFSHSYALRTSLKESDGKYRVLSWLEDITWAEVLFRSPIAQRYAASKTELLIGEYLSSRASHFLVLQIQNILAYILQAIGFAVVLGVGGYLVGKGQLTLGQLVAAELVLTTVLVALLRGAKQLENYYDLGASLEKLSHLLDCDIEEEKKSIPLKSHGSAELIIRETSYSDKTLLNCVGLSVKNGEEVAILGQHGSGKSLLADMIYGVVPLSSGEILIDGHAIEDLSFSQLRSAVALVRSPELLQATIEDNLKLGDENITRSDIRGVLNQVGLLDSILKLPDGLGTPINSNTRLLSAGQSVRLAIARALVRKPRLLILDGILDLIHGEQRKDLVKALTSKSSNCTLIVFTADRDLAEIFSKRYYLDSGVITSSERTLGSKVIK